MHNRNEQLYFLVFSYKAYNVKKKKNEKHGISSRIINSELPIFLHDLIR